MDTTLSLLAAILPLALLLLAAVVVRHAGSEEYAPRRVLLFAFGEGLYAIPLP